MLEHPEIGWMERTGYPSWLQEEGAQSPWLYERRQIDVETPVPMGIGLLKAARAHQRLCERLLSTPSQTGGEDFGISPG